MWQVGVSRAGGGGGGGEQWGEMRTTVTEL